MKKDKAKKMDALIDEFLCALIKDGGTKRELVSTPSLKWVVDMPPRQKKKPWLLYKVKRFFTPKWKRRPFISGLIQETYMCMADGEIMVMSKDVEAPEGLVFGTLLPEYHAHFQYEKFDSGDK